jgi:hypothetical protein
MRAKSQRRHVVPCIGVTAGRKGGGRPLLWAFGIPTLASLFGLADGTIKNMLSSKQLDPTDLSEVCRRWALRNGWTPPFPNAVAKQAEPVVEGG